MVLAQLNRYWSCNGGACGNPRTGRDNWPRDVMYYTCERCDQDFCPTCFHVVEKTIIIKKTEYDEDPDEFKKDQRAFCKSSNTYVKIETGDPKIDKFTVLTLNKDGTPQKEGFVVESNDLTKYVNI
jgi:hypothetical protein